MCLLAAATNAYAFLELVPLGQEVYVVFKYLDMRLLS